MLGRAWARFPEADAPGTPEDTATPQVFQCMGLAPVYIDGKLKLTLRGDHIVEEFITLLNDYVDRHYASVPLEAVDA